MDFKCPDCGASLTDDSRFCKYCGAKIDDGVKRAEIKIEDVAEIKRANYEEQESLLFQKRILSEAKRQKAKRITALVLLVVCALPTLYLFVFNPKNGAILAQLAAFTAVGFIAIAGFIVMQLLKGKW